MGRTDSLEKILMLGEWRQKKRGVAEDEMIGWHQRLSGHEFEQTPGDSAGQGCLEDCSPWGCRVGHDLATAQKQQKHTEITVL